MRAVVASADPDLRLALEVTLRHEPGFTVVAGVSDPGSLLGVVAASKIDLVVLDADLAVAVADIAACAESSLGGRRPLIALLAREEDTMPEGVDVVALKGEAPVILLRTLRKLRLKATDRRGHEPTA